MNSGKRALAVLMSLVLATSRLATAQSNCGPQVAEVQKHLQAFEREARQMGPGFVRADAAPITRAGLTSTAERLKEWDDGIEGYRSCLAREGCSIGGFIKGQETSNRELADWLKSLGDLGLNRRRKGSSRPRPSSRPSPPTRALRRSGRWARL